MLIPETWNGSNYYQYQYFFDFDDKVYYTEGDDNTRKEILNTWNKIRESSDSFYEDMPGTNKGEIYYHNDKFDIGVVEEFLKEHISNITQRNVVDIKFGEELWVNYQFADTIITMHSHVGLYGFVWYLDIPEEVRRECLAQPENTQTRGLIQFMSARTNHKMTFNPKTNDILIFKCGHNHQVYAFHTDNTRISMAGNIQSITFENGETLTTNDIQTY